MGDLSLPASSAYSVETGHSSSGVGGGSRGNSNNSNFQTTTSATTVMTATAAPSPPSSSASSFTPSYLIPGGSVADGADSMSLLLSTDQQQQRQQQQMPQAQLPILKSQHDEQQQPQQPQYSTENLSQQLQQQQQQQRQDGQMVIPNQVLLGVGSNEYVNIQQNNNNLPLTHQQYNDNNSSANDQTTAMMMMMSSHGPDGAAPPPTGELPDELDDEDNPNFHSQAIGLAAAEGEDGDPAENDSTDKRSIFVGNVDYGATPPEIQDHFRECGPINRITIMVDKFSGHPKGYAYVEFAEEHSVTVALDLNGTVFRDRPLKVTLKRKNLPGFVLRGGGRGSAAAAPGGFAGYSSPSFRGGRGRGMRGTSWRGGGRGSGGGEFRGGRGRSRAAFAAVPY